MMAAIVKRGSLHVAESAAEDITSRSVARPLEKEYRAFAGLRGEVTNRAGKRVWLMRAKVVSKDLESQLFVLRLVACQAWNLADSLLVGTPCPRHPGVVSGQGAHLVAGWTHHVGFARGFESGSFPQDDDHSRQCLRGAALAVRW